MAQKSLISRTFTRQWARAVALAALVSACASNRFIESADATNHGGKLELTEAKRPRPTPAPNELLVRYLRAGGVYFEWQGQALMTLPFASNYPLLDLDRGALFSARLAADERALAHVFGSDMPPSALDAVTLLIAGHSHYDHLGDLDVIAQRHARRARIYTNRSGKNMVAATPALRARTESYEGEPGWLPKNYRESGGLVRFHAIPSEHAPNFEFLGFPVSWATGEVTQPWQTPFAEHRLTELAAGKTHAFLLDFLDPTKPEKIAFRVHYQDAASRPPAGYPERALLAERAVDLEIVCMPGRETLPASATRYPAGILAYGGARHALVIHYEDFFRPVLDAQGRSNGVRLIPTLVGAAGEDFLHAISTSIKDPLPGPCAQPENVEGLCGQAFTLPLPGEWLRFRAELSAR